MTVCLSEFEFQRLIAPLSARLPDADREDSITSVIREILKCAQNFVPCEAGSLMLEHPDERNALVFVASFGTGSESLPGTVLPAGKGVAGQVFLSGEPALTNRPSGEKSHYKEIDRLTQHQTETLLCVPLKAFGRPVGVLSLLNSAKGEFLPSDLSLLTVFADYLTQSIELLIEARRHREAALRDHLTGLYNDRFLYRYLSDLIEQALQNDTDVGMIFLDLDHFKEVVDTYGHLVGSQALREIGILIGEVTNSLDGIAARYGGDEYVMILSDTQPERVLQLAERVRHAVENVVLVCAGEPDREAITLRGAVTASIGMATLRTLTSRGDTAEQLRQHLIREADEAMYVSKSLGKNRVHWPHANREAETDPPGSSAVG